MASNPAATPWCIRRKDQYNDYWSDTIQGWAAYDECTLYTSPQRNALGLWMPAHGYWSGTHRKEDER